MPVFTPQQDAALQAIAQWWKEGRARAPIFRLFGYAGTGKTTLVRHIAEDIKGKVLFAAFTGKAACVMRSKGCHGASTIHRLIYKPPEQNEENPTFELWHKAPATDAKLIIIDECSMVDAELARDLMSFEVPLLVLGDPAQLPPIQGGGFFTEAKPDAMLTEVHRQAQDNPIVRLSMDIRAGKPLAEGQYGETQVVRRGELDPKRVIGSDQVLVGRNVTRRAYNMRLRERRGLAGALPIAGDKLVCLRNNRQKGLFNGGLWVVKERRKPKRKRRLAERILQLRLKRDEELGDDLDEIVKVAVRSECFIGGLEELSWLERKPFDEFDYGYVLTVHKSQGSQWDDVVLFDESDAFRENRGRWLYTGVTRAAKRLCVVVP
jgi:exodeoxyribonuclease V